MQIKCVIDNTRSVKGGFRITLALGKQEKAEFLKNQINFEDKPLLVDFRVDAEEQQALMAQITDDQRRKLYALFNDVAKYTGDNVEATKINFKALFRKAYDYPDFSLSNCEKELASEFISYIVAWCIHQSVSLSQSPLEIVDDLTAYMYVCIQYKKCCICGSEGKVITGKEPDKVISLCDKHDAEARGGWKQFAEKYHVSMIAYAGT